VQQIHDAGLAHVGFELENLDRLAAIFGVEIFLAQAFNDLAVWRWFLWRPPLGFLSQGEVYCLVHGGSSAGPQEAATSRRLSPNEMDERVPNGNFNVLMKTHGLN
jgi:hypothetical protein